uniref:uncharacterized protein n=1 Tax=Pristiophorus japonicus TaxID=55135 RepID=UPI00398EA5C6
MADQTKPTAKARKLTRDSRKTVRRRREVRDPQGSQVGQAGSWSSGERFIIEKVHEFFQECGGDKKGFITRDDMQKLQRKFPFSAEQLDVVFDKLDIDGNDFLTPEELTKELSHFLTDQSQETDGAGSRNVPEALYQSQTLQQQVEVEDEEKQNFATLMERLGATTMFEDKSELWKLWVQLRRNEPNLLGNLEDFLSKVTGQIHQAQSEKDDLECTLKRRMMEHNAEVQRLYEEMELQINNEKERIESENVVKLHAQSQDLQNELDSKQEELVQTRTQLQAELVSLRRKQDQTSTEMEIINLTNQELESRLEQIKQELQEAQDRLVGQQEEAQYGEREGEWDQSVGSEGVHSDEAVLQTEASQGGGNDISEEDLRSEGLQWDRLTSSHVNRIISIEEDPLPQQAMEDAGIRGSRVTRQQVDMRTAKDGDDIFDGMAETLWRDGVAGPSEELQAELVSLRSKQDQTSTENHKLNLTNQELESRLEQIQQELQEAQDRLVGQQEEVQRGEREGEWDQALGSEGPRSDEAFLQLQAELVSLRSKQDQTSTENHKLNLTNQELELRLEQIQQELQEAQDRLVEAQCGEREGERDQSPGSEGPRSDEAVLQLQAELVSLRSKQDQTSTENHKLNLTNQELESRLEQIQQELQEAQNRLVGQQEEAQRGEREGEWDQSLGSEGPCSDEAVLQLQAELVSLRSKQDQTSTENHKLNLTNRELESRLEQIQQELQEAQDRLVGQQEEAQCGEREGERDQSPGSEGPRSNEAVLQLQAELVSLRSKQDQTSTENHKLNLTNQELELQLEQIQQELQEAQNRLVGQQEEAQRGEREGFQRTRSIRRRAPRDTSITADPLGEGPGLPHLRVEGEEVSVGPGADGGGAGEETAARDGAAETIKELQAELVSLRSKQDQTSTENHKLNLTNQELESRLEQIQQELQEAQDPQRGERDGEWDQSLGSEGPRSDEAVLQLQAELIFLHSKQDQTSTENRKLNLTNQELESRLEQIQQELQEAQDQLVGQQEEAQHGEREGERDQSLGSEGPRSDEAVLQLQAELVSLRSKQDQTSTENHKLNLTNQELESRLEQIQQELQEAKDRLVGQQEEAQHGEREGERDQSLGSEGPRSDEAVLQLQAELISLRSKQDQTSTENHKLNLTNQELESRLEQIQQELQEAQDRLVEAQRREREREHDQSPGSEGPRSDEAVLQLQAELVSLRSKQDQTSTENHKLNLTNQELESRLEQIQQELQEAQDRLVGQQEEAQRGEREGFQRTRSIRRRAPRDTSITADPLGEGLGLPHLRVEGEEVSVGPGADGGGAGEETAARDGAAETIKELQAELISLRSKQDQTSTENHKLNLTNQELESRLEQIQQELQEAQDRLVEAQRGEREGERDQSPGSEGPRSDEAALQLQAELVSLRSKQDQTSTENHKLNLTNQKLESRLEQIQQELQEAQDRLVGQQEEAQRGEREGFQRTRSIRRRAPRDTSITADPLGEGPGLPHLRVEGEEVRMGSGADGGGAGEETAASDGAAETIKELQAELVSLRSKQDQTSTENHKLSLTNQELVSRLEQIQQELQEAQARLVEAQRGEREGERDQSPGSVGPRSDEAFLQLQAELVSLRSKQDQTSTENHKLNLTNQELESRLEQIQRELQEAQDRLVGQQEEAQRGEREGFQRTRSIRRRAPRDTSITADPLGEGPGLPHLRVEGEEVSVGSGADGGGAGEETAARDGAAETIKELQAELISLRSKQDQTSTENHKLNLTNQELVSRLEQIQHELQEAQDRNEGEQEQKEGFQRTRSIRRRAPRDTSITADPLEEGPGLPHLRVEGEEVSVGSGTDGGGAGEETAARDGAAETIKEVERTKEPDHLYNIMFVGNPNTGKTSFIQRFHDDNFEPGLAATVGIDYRVKTLRVGNKHIALQLWDTAGQERFRSVTKQFFRKADGVIVMYDITSFSSFTEVHYWLTCVKEAAADEVSILLLGNKMDNAPQRQVSTFEGQRLAQEHGILFAECSACTGHNINPPMVQLTKLLKQQEEKIKEAVVEIEKRPTEKGKCCT